MPSWFGSGRIPVWCRIAVKLEEYSRRQLAGGGALAGIGFTMSLFIAGQAFPAQSDFAATKIAVFAASILSAMVGTALLWNARRANDDGATSTDINRVSGA